MKAEIYHGTNPPHSHLIQYIKLTLQTFFFFPSLESDLLQLLQASGWTEQLRALCTERMRDPEAGVGSYGDLRRAVDGEAREMVPEEVRVEMVKKVMGVLKSIVEE